MRSRDSRRAVLLDRDGVVVVNRDDYVKDISEVEFIPGSLDAVRVISQLGFGLAVVSNQSAVGRGIIDRQEADRIQDFVLGRLSWAAGTSVVGWICPHLPEVRCRCRKPETKLLSQAIESMAVDTDGSYMVGDAMTDLVAGKKVGLQSVLVRTGRERSAEKAFGIGALVYESLAEFAGALIVMSKDCDG